MKTSSAKSKGRMLQRWVVEKILETLPPFEEDDCRSTSMGAGGEDVQLSPALRVLLPYSFECKNQEKLNVWQAYKQAEENCKGYEPVVVIKRNRQKPLLVIDADYFIKMHK